MQNSDAERRPAVEPDALEAQRQQGVAVGRTEFLGADESAAGHVLLLIGYGVDHCPGENSGTKLRTTDTIFGWVTDNDFETQGRGANQGDSGGPVFDPDTMAVMGVISRGSFDVCSGVTVVAAVAPWKDMVNQALTDTGDCAPTTMVDV
ncbi:MAG: trypsin-like serine protease, partial [Pseudomonadota bacterium]